MAITMTAPWWTSNKAKTLGVLKTSPETLAVTAVTTALTNWDTKVRNKAIRDWSDSYITSQVIPCANAIIKAATALKALANKVAHGATIGYLDNYIKVCNTLLVAMNHATGEHWGTQYKTASMSDADIALLKKMDEHWWPSRIENYGFLKTMKASGDHGNEAMYQKYILGASSEHGEINMPGSVLARIKAARAAGRFGPEDGWMDAKKAVLSTFTQASSFSAPMKLFQQKKYILDALLG